MTKQSYAVVVSSSPTTSMANQAHNSVPTTSNTTNPSVINAFHPYFMQSSDNPGIVLVTQTLSAHNYQQ